MKSSFLKDATLVFDLDGTLVDTAPDLIGALNHVLDGTGSPAVDPDLVRPFISFGARRMIVEGLSIAGKALSDDEVDALLERFLEFYDRNIAVESMPYPNVIGVLDATAGSGARLGVCTNKREALSRALLTQLGLHDRFGAIVGRDTLDVYKPNPRHLTETIARAGGRIDRAIMIGDSPVDVATAKAAGVPVVAVSFGYSEIPAASFGADVVIDDYSELMEVLPDLLGQ